MSFHEKSNTLKLQSADPQNDDNRSDVFTGAGVENGDLIYDASNSDSTDDITGNPPTQMDTEILIDSVPHYPSLRGSQRKSRLPECHAARINKQSRDSQLDSATPLSFEKAKTGAECNEWKLAMKEEFHTIEEKEYWKLVPRRQHAKPIKISGCVQRRKRKYTGTLQSLPHSQGIRTGARYRLR